METTPSRILLLEDDPNLGFVLQEFLQHKVKEKHFFGEPAVLLEKPFPGNVEVTSEFVAAISADKLASTLTLAWFKLMEQIP